MVKDMDEDGWTEDVVGFRWSSSGDELLVQQTESIRVFELKDDLVEKSVNRIFCSDVIGFGFAKGDWWVLHKQDGQVVYQRGLEGKWLTLEELVAAQASQPALSPDARTIACVVSDSKVAFWSTEGGEKLFGIRVTTEGEAVDLFGAPSIERINWSPNSRNLVIQPDVPVSELMVIDVARRRTLGTVA